MTKRHRAARAQIRLSQLGSVARKDGSIKLQNGRRMNARQYRRYNHWTKVLNDNWNV